jgi:hypothetical protein
VLLSELLTANRVRVPLRSQSKDDLLRELVELATAGRDDVTSPRCWTASTSASRC